jgi:leader peptidase (prepilin peptidase)/N-methyltransferase
MEIAANIIIYLFVFVVGTVIGSFLNVLIYRIPRKLDFVKGRSFCPNCDHSLGALDLIPVLSYLALGRKCRYCAEPISPRYMVVELIGGAGALLCFAAFCGVPIVELTLLIGDTCIVYETLLIADAWLTGFYAPYLGALLYFVVFCILLVVTVIDTDTMEIPNGLNIALAVCGVLAVLVGPQVALLDRAIGLFCVSAPLFIIAFIVPGAFGGGDIKLMAAAGILLGWQQVLVAAFIGIIIGGVYGVYLMVTRKKGRKEHFAFGPALCVGIATSMFLGDTLLSTYIGLFK